MSNFDSSSSKLSTLFVFLQELGFVSIKAMSITHYIAKELQKYDILFYEMLVIFIRCVVVVVAVVFVCWYGSSPATGQRPGVPPNLGTGPGPSWQQ